VLSPRTALEHAGDGRPAYDGRCRPTTRLEDGEQPPQLGRSAGLKCFADQRAKRERERGHARIPIDRSDRRNCAPVSRDDDDGDDSERYDPETKEIQEDG